MKLLSVNVAMPKEVPYQNGTLRTGIFKQPVQGPVMARTLNLEGDGQADRENHGGIYKAIYVYSIENYDHWRRELGRDDFSFGQFGENFTVEEMVEDQIYIGDSFRVGGALVQVTQPRAPCQKLGLKMGSAQFPKVFLRSGRVGFYLQVLEEGEVAAGAPFEPVGAESERINVRQMSRLRYLDPDDVEGAKRALRIQMLPPRWRRLFEERVSRAETEGAPECCEPLA